MKRKTIYMFMLVFAILAIMLAGCTSPSTPGVDKTKPSSSTPPSTSKTPAPTSPPVSSPVPAPAPTTSAAKLTLTILDPLDESVLNDVLLRVAGRTSPEAVVSVNGHIVTGIDQEGNFATVVTMAEGPNLLEIIASDFQGNQTSQTLTVIYIP